MLNEKTIEAIAGLAKVEVTALKEAISSADEKEITLPEGIQAYTPTELKTLVDNEVSEIKPNLQTSAVEVAFKSLGRELGLPETVRDGKTFAKLYSEKVINDAKIEPNKLKDALSEKDELLKRKDEEIKRLNENFETFKFKSQVSNAILNNLGESKILSKEERAVLFNARYDFRKTETGIEFVDRTNNNVVKDNLKNPMPVDILVKEFDKKYLTQGGREGSSGSEGSSGKLTNEQIIKQLEAKGLARGSVEYYNEFNKLLNQK